MGSERGNFCERWKMVKERPFGPRKCGEISGL
jgi:hypothetical protein